METTMKKWAYGLVIIGSCIAILILARTVLVPIVLAAILAYLILALTQGIQKIHFGTATLPRTIAMVISSIMMAMMVYIFILILRENIQSLSANFPMYMDTISGILERASKVSGGQLSENPRELLASLNLESRVGSVAKSLTNVTGNLILVLIYTVFMLIEYKSFQRKIANMINPDHTDTVQRTMVRIESNIMTYLRIKAFVSLLIGVASYIVLALFGVQMALLWAILIFLLNFIPTIGSIIAIAFPAVITFLQFGSASKFVMVTGILILIQLIIENVVEPRIASKSLSISPLMIIISLSFAGLIWGVMGMILAVPIIIVVKIITEQVPGLQPIAVLLSHEERQ